MKNLEKLAEEVKAAMEELSGKEIKIYHGLNRNGKPMTGLTIRDPYINTTPVVYIDPEKDFDIPVKKLAKTILDVIEENMPKWDFDASQFTDYERAKKRIIMTLVSKSYNEELLKKVPYVNVTNDLVVIFKYNIMNRPGQAANIVVHNEHMEGWGVSVAELFNVARTNTPVLFPVEITKLSSFASERMQRPVEDAGYYILTNEQKLSGATAMVYPSLLKKLCGMHRCQKLLILPSSVNDLLFYPVANDRTLDWMIKESLMMVHEVNATLEPGDFLSDSVYVYDGLENKLTSCSME